MPTSIDELYIEINANAVRANDAIDRLVGKLDRLSISLGKINSSGLNNLANGVQRLGTSMQTINSIRTADISKLATSITQLSSLNNSQIKTSALAINTFGNAVKKLSAVSGTSMAIGTMAGNIAKLGSQSGTQAITNIPLLTTALNNLFVTLSRSPRVNQNIIDMTNALANLSAQGSRVGYASNAMVSGLNRTTSSVKTARKHVLSLASAFGRFYASYFLVIRGLKGLWKSIESTADYIEAFNYYNVAFGKIASEWDKDWEKYGYENGEIYAESFTQRMDETFEKLSGLQVDQQAGLLNETGLKNLGLNIQEVTQYASQLASVTNSIGQTGETTVAISTAFTKLAGDISSLFNIDFQTVSKNLQSGLIGQSRALYKYGIDIRNATLQTRAYELGVEKSVSEMTQMEKQQLRVIEILEQSKVSWGDLANTINSPSNMIRQFKNNLKETGMVLGQLFIPVLERTLPVINGFTIALKRMFVNLASVLGIKIDFDAFGKGYSEMEDDVDSLTEGLDELEESAKEAQAGLRGFDELKVINLGSAKTTNQGLEATIDLTQEIIDATREYENEWNKAFESMENMALKFADSIINSFKPLGKYLEAFFLNIKLGRSFFVGKDIGNIAVVIFDSISNSLKSFDWRKLGNDVGDLLKGINWMDVVRSGFQLGENIWIAIKDAWIGTWETAPLETAIITAITGMKLVGLTEAFRTAIYSSLGVTGGVATVGGAFAIAAAIFVSFELAEDAKEWWSNIQTLGWEEGRKKAATDNFANPYTEKRIQDLKILSGKIEGFFENIRNHGKETGRFLGEKFKALSNWFDGEIAPWFTREKWEQIGKGMKDGLSNSFKKAIEYIKTIWEAFKKYISDLSFLDVLSGTFSFLSGIRGTIGSGLSIDGFATGGYPTKGDLFFANEMGPELIGTMNGKTAVASNGEITGISDAIYGTAELELQLMREQNSLLRELLTKEFGITDSQIGESARRYANDYHRRTGDYAFI